jgi:DNA-binding FadR family transcriptional regulator
MEKGRDDVYARVFSGLLGQIRNGIYPPGGRLPSTPALAEYLGVSRATVLRVTERLRWIGLIVGPAGGIARVASEPRRSAALSIVDEAERVRSMPE